MTHGSPDVRTTAMHTFDLTEVRNRGVEAVAGQGLSVLEDRGLDGFWVHLDEDVLNDAVMPAVDYRMPDGLWPGELADVLSLVLKSPLAMGLEITIYNPLLDDEDRSAARVLAQVVTTAFANAA